MRDFGGCQYGRVAAPRHFRQRKIPWRNQRMRFSPDAQRAMVWDMLQRISTRRIAAMLRAALAAPPSMQVACGRDRP